MLYSRNRKSKFALNHGILLDTLANSAVRGLCLSRNANDQLVLKTNLTLSLLKVELPTVPLDENLFMA